LKHSYLISTVVIVAVIISASALGAYTLFSPQESRPSSTPSATSTPTSEPTTSPSLSGSPTIEPTSDPSAQPTSTPTPTATPALTPTPTPEPTTVIVQDWYGRSVNVSLPVERIAVLNGGMAEVICALGGADKIVATAGNMVYPPVVLTKPSLSSSTTSLSLEALFSVNPDLVVVDQSFSNDSISKIIEAGIPVYVDNVGYTERISPALTNLGLILDNAQTAAKIIQTNTYYTNLIQQRIANANLTTATKTSVYFEWNSGGTQWRTRTNGTQQNEILLLCGGMNIAAGSAVGSPYISPEVVGEANPDVIIVTISGTLMGFNTTNYQNTYNEITSRSILQETDAVKNGRVYIYYYYLTHGIQHPIGELYFAKWLYPTLFADIDVAAIHAQLTQEYFGIALTGTWVYSGA
jgi:iron complex transport system substrate-binding protein